MDEKKVYDAMLGLKSKAIIHWLTKLQKGHQAKCPWCNQTKWLIVTKNGEEDQVAIQGLTSIKKVIDGEKVRMSTDTIKTDDLSIVMRCANCGYENRFQFFFHLCMQILEENEKLNNQKDKEKN